MGDAATALIWVVAFVVIAVLFIRRRRSGRPPGAGTAGTVYDWLNEDKQRAVDIIVEARAGARDPEDRDGNLPDLEHRPKS